MKLSGLIPYVLALVAFGGVALAQQQPVNTESPPEQLSQPPQSSSPRRLTINVTVVEPEDLKVTEGDEIQPGQLLADRGRERQVAWQRLEQSTVTLPVPSAQTPAISHLTCLKWNTNRPGWSPCSGTIRQRYALTHCQVISGYRKD